LTGQTGTRLVWSVCRNIEIPPRLKLAQGWASKSSWSSMRRRELPRSRRDDQMKLRMQIRYQHFVSNRIFAHIKVGATMSYSGLVTP
jgi:hypothetical protein